jgi:fibro-slime domain-containing protein
MKIEQDPLRLPVIYRDFKGFDEPGGHPDFQRFIGAGEAGIPAPMLDMTGKPAHAMGPRRLTVNGDPGYTDKDYFAIWWRDNPAYNRTFREQLVFMRGAAGTYQYGSNAFYPLEGRGFGPYMGSPAKGGGHRNFHFTSEVRHWFEYRGGERLDFTGDDDVFVFINKRLTVDLGGTHMAVTGRVTLDATTGAARVCDLASPCVAAERTIELGLAIGSVYEMVVFQAERRTDESNYRLSMANFSGSRTSCASVCGDGIVTPDEACDLGKDKNTGAYGTCNADCTLTPRCGDGILNGPEDCDGGPTCNSTCRLLTVD